MRYHLRRLVGFGLIEEIQQVRSRGGAVRVFQTTPAFRESIVAILSQGIVRLAAIAYPDIGPSAMAVLDEQALGELSDDMEHLFARIGEMRAQTAARATRSWSPLPTIATAVLFAIGGANPRTLPT